MRERAEVYILSLLISVVGMVYNSLEIMQTQTKPLNLMLDGGIPGSVQRWRPEMRKDSLSGLDFLEVPPWSMLLP